MDYWRTGVSQKNRCHLSPDKDEACDQANQIMPPRIYYHESDQNESNRKQIGNKKLVPTGCLIEQ